jgi:glyoxylase-like metal-dependent hydrolase (beta-lactamase superfamily II)
VSGPGASAASLAPGVHRLGTDLVNWYLVDAGDEGLTAVDAGLPGYGDLMEEQLRALGRRPDEIRAVVLTHGHSDHTGLVRRIADAGARVLIHEDDVELLRNPGGQRPSLQMVTALRHGHARRFMWQMGRAGGTRPTRFESPETYGDGAELDVPGHPRAIHTPGHTAGHCVLQFPRQGALFAGDLICTLSPVTGRTGVQPFPSAFNADSQRLMASLGRLEDLDAGVVLPGHGDPLPGSPADAARSARAVGMH